MNPFFRSVLSAVALALPQLAQAQVASFHAITPPDGRFISVRAMSGDGRVLVGASPGEQAFRWTIDDGLQFLDLPDDGLASNANRVSFDGGVIVGETALPDRRQVPCMWTPAGYQEIPVPHVYSFANAVSDDGRIVAGYRPDDTAFRWTAEGGYQSLGGRGGVRDMSADGSVIVGYDALNLSSGFMWTEADGIRSLPPLPPTWTSVFPDAVSADSSTIVGRLQRGFPIYESRAFRWTEAGGYELLEGVVPGSQTMAFDTSADGAVVVGVGVGGACIWFEDGSVRRVVDLLAELGLDLGGMELVDAIAISADGLTIGGNGISDNRFVAWAAHIPTPGAAATMVCCLALTCRRRRARPRRTSNSYP